MKIVSTKPSIFSGKSGYASVIDLRTEWTAENIHDVDVKQEFESQNGDEYLAVGKVIHGAASLTSGGISLNSYEFALFVKVDEEWNMVLNSNVILGTPDELEDVSGKVIWYLKNNEVEVLSNSPLSKTLSLLEDKVVPARPNCRAEKELVYSNSETGTAIYRVRTSNAHLQPRELIVWTYYLIGNADGYTSTPTCVASEAKIDTGEISEDNKKIVIPQKGSQTVDFGIEISAEDIVINKDELKLYEDHKPAEA